MCRNLQAACCWNILPTGECCNDPVPEPCGECVECVGEPPEDPLIERFAALIHGPKTEHYEKEFLAFIVDLVLFMKEKHPTENSNDLPF